MGRMTTLGWKWALFVNPPLHLKACNPSLPKMAMPLNHSNNDAPIQLARCSGGSHGLCMLPIHWAFGWCIILCLVPNPASPTQDGTLGFIRTVEGRKWFLLLWFLCGNDLTGLVVKSPQASGHGFTNGPTSQAVDLSRSKVTSKWPTLHGYSVVMMPHGNELN
jgi:hypothetical protein